MHVSVSVLCTRQLCMLENIHQKFVCRLCVHSYIPTTLFVSVGLRVCAFVQAYGMNLC